jgi:hypothetical protein
MLILPGQTLGRVGDQVGHIVGNQFGGYANQTQGWGNFFPQDGPTNTVAYRDFERRTWAITIEHGCDVCARWTFTFNPASNTPYRPTSFTVEWWENGHHAGTQTFNNP